MKIRKIKDIFEMVTKEDGDWVEKCQKVSASLISCETEEKDVRRLNAILYKLKDRLRSTRNEERFRKKYRKWLENKFKWKGQPTAAVIKSRATDPSPVLSAPEVPGPSSAICVTDPSPALSAPEVPGPSSAICDTDPSPALSAPEVPGPSSAICATDPSPALSAPEVPGPSSAICVPVPGPSSANQVTKGRKRKAWGELTERSKRRRIDEQDSQELYEGTVMKLKKKGQKRGSIEVAKICEDPYKKYEPEQKKKTTKTTSEEALLWYIEVEASTETYERTRQLLGNLPSYKTIQRAKKDAYPEGIVATEEMASVSVGALVCHTAERILQIPETHASIPDGEELELFIKWGCDGSSPATNIKQAWLDPNAEDRLLAELPVFVSSLAPLELRSSQTGEVFWKNPVPCSPRFCRPIRIAYKKETVDSTKEEVDHVKTSMEDIEFFEIKVGDRVFNVKPTLMLTMVDGKVCNALMGNASTMRCYICRSTAAEFSDVERAIQRPVNQESISFGLSPLHCRIRVMEFLVHLADRLPVEKKARQRLSSEEEAVMKENKDRIRKEMRNQLGLLIDVVKKGFGTTNDGNTARRFFDEIEVVGEILKLDINLLYRFKIILQVVGSGRPVKAKFESYCIDTARMLVAKYPWCNMSPTVHKLLIHAPIIIEKAGLPIGLLSEEAAEATNKVIRCYREHHSRRMNRQVTNLDVIRRLLLMSDPLLSTMSRRKPKKEKPFLKEAEEFLIV